MATITMNEQGSDVRYESFPGAVTLQYYDKQGHPVGVIQTQEFLTLASYLLWVMTQSSYFVLGSQEYSEFAYFAASRPINKLIKLETDYVIRSYEFHREVQL